MAKLTPRHQTVSRQRRSRRNRPIVEEKGKVDLHDSDHLHAPPLPCRADANIAGTPNFARRSTMKMTSPKTTAAIARNLAASNPIHTSPRQLAIGTRRASRGVRNGSARRWKSIMSNDPSFLCQMVATLVAATRVMADSVGI